MSRTQRANLTVVMLVLILLLFLIRLMRGSIEVVDNWGNDLIDPILLYFIIIAFTSFLFKNNGPHFLLCFVGSVGIAFILEYLQFLEIKLLFFPIGNYSPIDYWVYLLGGLIAIAIDKKYVRVV